MASIKLGIVLSDLSSCYWPKVKLVPCQTCTDFCLVFRCDTITSDQEAMSISSSSEEFDANVQFKRR
jgi:hypothetical protein